MEILEDKAQLEETIKWCNLLKTQADEMNNRIRSNIARGRSIVVDSAIQTQFIKLTEYHAQVLQRMQKLDEDKAYHESLQCRLNQIVELRTTMKQRQLDLALQRFQQQQQEIQARRQQQQQIYMPNQQCPPNFYQAVPTTPAPDQQLDPSLQRFQQQQQEIQARGQQQQQLYMPNQQCPPNFYQAVPTTSTPAVPLEPVIDTPLIIFD